jgi:hypothetical protein
MRLPADLLALACAAACAALLLAAPALPVRAQGAQAQDGAAAEKPRPRVYRWIDENGIAHYTTDPDRIPSRLRNAVGLPPPGEATTAPPPVPSPAAPAAAPAAAATSNPLGMDASPATAAAPALSPNGDFEEGPAPGEAAGAQRADLDARIATLQAEIAADEEAIQAMISAAEPGPGALAADDPAFREIAMRLPKRLADLRALEQERARLGEP